MLKSAANTIKRVKHFNLGLTDRANNPLATLVTYSVGAEIFSRSCLLEDEGHEKDKILKQKFQFRFEMPYLVKR